MIHDGAELGVEADGKDQSQSQVEDVSPKKRREAAQCEEEAMKEDVATFGHDGFTRSRRRVGPEAAGN